MSLRLTSLATALALAAAGACSAEPEGASDPGRVGRRADAGIPSPGTPERTDAPERAAGSPIDDPEARALLEALSGDSATRARSAIDRVRSAHDTRFVAVFVELMRAAETGHASPKAHAESVQTLEALTGESLGSSWAAWVEWLAGSDLVPPPGFTGWKGRLLGRIDPRFEALLADDAPSRIRVEEIVWGGVAYEGIPALDRAPVLAAGDADYLGDDEPVFGIALGGEARAYPLRILDWHEMANDELGGVSFSLAYCTLCGAGIAYRGRASDGRVYDFGSSGLLMRSNKLMGDRQTRTLWNQFTGRPVLGPLAAGDVSLERLPVVVTAWQDWRTRHPETTVLSLDTGHQRPYLPGAAYGGYFASPETMFPVRRQRRLLPSKARVFGLQLAGIPKAYPVERLLEAGVVNDDVAGKAVALVATGPAILVEGRSLRSGPARYEAGTPVRAYLRGEHRFRLPDDGEGLLDGAGRRWRLTEEALVAPDGERAERVAGHLAYWFGWNAYYPRSLVFGASGTDREDRP